MDCLHEGLEVTPETRSRVEAIVVAGLESNDDRRRKMAAEVQLVRHIQSMVRVDEDTYQSRELVPNAIFELFAREAPDHLTPKPFKRFPMGDGGKAVYGVSGSAASQFCISLSHRSSEWRFELPTVCLDLRIGAHWRKDPAGFWCCYLPNDWEVLTRKGLRDRFAREDYKTRFRNALDFDLAHARDLALGRDFACPPDLAHALDLVLSPAFDLARALDPVLNRVLAGLDLEETEALSLLLSGLIRPESDSAGVLTDLFFGSGTCAGAAGWQNSPAPCRHRAGTPEGEIRLVQ